ncbi:MAG: gliding motility-associated C-terminal domain-containing protein [Bacteroidota bacterium]
MVRRITLPQVDLGQDTTLCEDNPLTLTAPTAPGGSIIWSDGSTASDLIPTTSGIYWLEITEQGCSVRDSIQLVYDESFDLDLGRDTIICDGEELTLAGLGGLDEYEWSTAEATPSITVNSEDTYTLIGRRGACQAADEIVVDVSRIAPFSIGEDQVLCEGQTAEFMVPEDVLGMTTWSTGSQEEMITVSTDAEIFLEVERDGCTRRDTASVSFQTAITVDLGPDTMICAGETIELRAGFPSADLLWSTGETTDQILVQQAGDVFVSVQEGACDATDTVSVLFIILPEINLGGDTTLCEGVDLTLAVDPLPDVDIRWSDTSTDTSIQVTTSGVYAVEISQAQCQVSDSVAITFDPEISFTLGLDETACDGDTISLSTGIADFDNLTWNNGTPANEPIAIVTESSINIATVTRGTCQEVDTVQITFLDLNAIDLGGEQSACQGDTIILDATIGGVDTYSWTTLSDGNEIATTPVVEINAEGDYVVMAETQGCSTSDTVMITIDPTIGYGGLGPDTSLCEGAELVLDPPDVAGVNFIWSDRPGTDPITVTESLTVGVVLSRGACLETDEITVNFNPNPALTLPTDRSACEGSTVTLDATTADVEYQWSTSETTSTIDVDTSGTYTVRVTDSNGCDASADIDVSFVAPPQFTLRSDTAICDGGSVEVSSNLTPSGDLEFSWSTGQLTPTIVVDESGTYDLQITNQAGCFATESFSLDVLTTPTFVLPETAEACEGDAVDLQVIVSSDNFMWSTGETSPEISVSSSEVVWAEASIGTCSFRDSTVVTIIPLPIVELPMDNAICEGQTITLDAGAGADSYLWSTGATTATIEVGTTDTYSVEVTTRGCSSEDDVAIVVNPAPMFDLGEDRSICAGDEAVLSAEPGPWSITWSTGESTDDISVINAGTYTVLADLNGCILEDEITISVRELPVFSLGEDVTRCDQFSTSLTADVSGLDYLWSTGDIGQSINVNTSGTFTATAMDEFGCTFSDDITVTDRECSRFRLYVPNAFRPETGGDNSMFFVSPSDNAIILEYSMAVYDRWGNEVFATEDINAQWNGRTPDFGIQSGVLTYLISVRYSDDFETDRLDKISGTVTVIR